ncbi:MAG TPA: hypothetical protein PKL08_12575 [Thermoanaerobaculaceae bacterium]|mgnify:CR=1 FL=1|nr:hypothetical protein [Thermoanaerobaculaceae bacterium]
MAMTPKLLVVVLAAALTSGGCGAQTNSPQPVSPDALACHLILFDFSEDTALTIERVTEVTTKAAEAAAEAPGTRLEFWAQGETVQGTRALFSTVSSASKVGGKRQKQLQIRRFVKATVDTVVGIMQGLLSAPPPRSSPIAASITKVARSRDCKCHCTIVVISDINEYSAVDGQDQECSQTLVSQKDWTAYLDRIGALTPGQLEGIDLVTFAYVDLGPRTGNRCPGRFSLARQQVLEALWKGSVTRSGAKSAEVRSGPPSFVNYTTTQKGDK